MVDTLGTQPLPRAAKAHRSFPRVRPAVELWLTWVGAAAVPGLWWLDTPYVSGLGEWLTGAGRIPGLLAGYAVVVLIALMSRFPALGDGVGTDRLARWHAMGGRYTVSLTVAYGLLILWGYAVTAHTEVVRQSGVLVLSYPDVLAATVAGLLLPGIGVVSARAGRDPGADDHRDQRGHPLWAGPSTDHRDGHQNHGGDRHSGSFRERQGPGNQQLCRSPTHPGSACSPKPAR